MTTTAILGFPYIASQQNQPELTHNEALNMLQAIQGTGVISIGDNTPPVSPSEGDSYVVGTAPTGAWANRENCVAIYLSSQWWFVPGNDSNGTPITMGVDQEGLRVWSKADDVYFVWTDKGVSPGNLSWEVLTLAAETNTFYGGITISNNSTPIAVTAAVDTTLKTNSDYTQITGIWDAIPSGENNGVTQNTNSFTIQNDGVYHLNVYANVSSNTNNTRIAIKFAVNGVINLVRRPAALVTTSGEFYPLAGHGIAAFSAGDVISLYHAANKSVNVTWEDMVFSCHELRRV